MTYSRRKCCQEGSPQQCYRAQFRIQQAKTNERVHLSMKKRHPNVRNKNLFNPHSSWDFLVHLAKERSSFCLLYSCSANLWTSFSCTGSCACGIFTWPSWAEASSTAALCVDASVCQRLLWRIKQRNFQENKQRLRNFHSKAVLGAQNISHQSSQPIVISVVCHVLSKGKSTWIQLPDLLSSEKCLYCLVHFVFLNYDLPLIWKQNTEISGKQFLPIKQGVKEMDRSVGKYNSPFLVGNPTSVISSKPVSKLCGKKYTDKPGMHLRRWPWHIYSLCKTAPSSKRSTQWYRTALSPANGTTPRFLNRTHYQGSHTGKENIFGP